MSNKDEISLRNVIEQTERYIRFLLSKWLIIVIMGFIGGVLGVVYAFTSKPEYSATLNFVLSGSSSSSSGLMGFASQFGVNLGNNTDNVFSGDNIITLMQSRRMVQQALFMPVPDSNQSLLNIYIKNNEINKGWDGDAKLKNTYPFPSTPDKMTLIQDSIFRIIYSSIEKGMLNVYKLDKNQNIYVVVTRSQSELFSYYLTRYLVDVTSSFYISAKTSIARKNLVMLQKEADSLRAILSGTIVSVGSETDLTFNLNPAYQVRRSGALESQARASALGQAYGQVLQNLEIAKITLQKETPLYQVIDEPTLPLMQEKPRKLTSLIMGGFIGGLLILMILIAKKMFSDFKSQQPKNTV